VEGKDSAWAQKKPEARKISNEAYRRISHVHTLLVVFFVSSQFFGDKEHRPEAAILNMAWVRFTCACGPVQANELRKTCAACFVFRFEG
jgi:hypothetical protein